MSERGIIHLSETESTNKYIRTVEKDGICVIADRQSGGRGRMGRTFESPMGGLYMSFKCHSRDVVGDALTAKTAVAAARAIEKLTGLDTWIKWVNDIYVNGRKICGILAEGVWRGTALEYIIIGIGVNLEGQLPESLSQIATTVEAQGGIVPDRTSLAREIMAEFDSIEDFVPEYRAKQYLVGKPVTVFRGGESFPAIAESIDDLCRMVVRLQSGDTLAVASGEVSVRASGL